jgi:hypothetical protein
MKSAMWDFPVELNPAYLNNNMTYSVLSLLLIETLYMLQSLVLERAIALYSKSYLI